MEMEMEMEMELKESKNLQHFTIKAKEINKMNQWYNILL